MEEEFILVKDFVSEDGHFYVNKAERVRVLKTDDNDPTLLLVQVYEDLSRTGLVPMDYLKKVPASRTNTPDSLGHSQKSRKQEAKFNREVCINELIETEEEFGQLIQKVVENYLTPLEEEIRAAPRTVMDSKEIIFHNLGQISSFHNGIMIPGVKYFLKEPKTIGRTFLRLERDFDKHAEYVKNEPCAQELLAANDEIRDYFEDISQEVGDDKTLADHLKLPIQRINDYTLLLQDLIKYSRVLSEDITDLERALELMLWIPTRCNDLKFITNIEGYHGNIHKLGRLIRHNWFLVKDKENTKGRERYCFLFKARLLICKVRRISEDRCVFVLKEIIKLPEVDFKNRNDKRTFEIHSTEPDAKNFPFFFTAHEDDIKADWLREIQQHSEDNLTLAEHVADDLKVQSQQDEDLFEPLKGIELDISPDIEESLGPIEKPGHKPLKHVPEPKRPPLEIPKKRVPIFTCVDPSPSPEPEPEPEPQPEPEDMYSTYNYEEVTVKEEVYVERYEEEEDEVEELIEISNEKRKPKYVPGVSKPLFHSTIRGSSNERTELFDEEYNWWRYTSGSLDFHRKKEYKSSIAAGENATFECQVEGVNKLTWLKDNRPLSDRLADRIVISEDNGVYRLEIKNISETDSGTYTARAENDCGVSFSTAHLIVEKLSDEEKKARVKATSPIFLVQLKDAELLESTHARFMVKVNGNPMPTVEFYHGDRLIDKEDKHIEIVQDKEHLGFYEMVIAEVGPQDAGEYRCVASNKYSEETCSCIVNVVNEKDLFVGLEDDLPGGVPKFSWLKNGKPFAPEERFKVIYKDEENSIALVFQNVKPEDAGLYTCVASTSHGKISCSAELTVQGTIKELEKQPKKPKIECVTREFEGNVASTGVMEVKVTGDPMPQIRWFRDGEEIISAGRYKLIYEEESEAASLVIKNLNLQDSGEYNMVAKNKAGSDSQFMTLHVKAPPRITKRLQDFTGLTGQELKLTINVNASPKPIVQWYKDGIVIKKSERVKYVTNEELESYTLLIDNAVMDDAGTYSVVASNEFSQASDACHISMESPPQFIGTLTKEIETLEGDYVSFSVIVDGDPLPAVKWKLGGNEILNDGKHYKMSSEGNVFTLLISEVEREDAGSYSCEISNEWGANKCDGQLFVKCLPRFDKQLQDMRVNDSDTDVEFTVKLNCFPEATITWYHDESEITSSKKEYTCIEDGDTYKLIIKQANTKLSGVYKCKAENEIGFKETSATLSVYTFPAFKKELTDVEITEGETLKLTVSCQGVPEPDLKWYRNGEEIYSDSRIKISRDAKRIENYNLTITLIRPDDGGEYEVRAANERGTAVTKSFITVLASTDHKKRSTEETRHDLVDNQEPGTEEKEKCTDDIRNEKQVKDKITAKQPAKNNITDLEEADQKRDNCRNISLKKLLSADSGDDDVFTVRELCNEEFVAATELKASSFGLVEEPPENERYIKINVSRGVSIVSVSEDETVDEQSSSPTFEDCAELFLKKSKNIYELNEEDELHLEINDDLVISPQNESTKCSVFQRHSNINESVLNAINRRLSSLSENNNDLISYNSSRKSSFIEENGGVSAKEGTILKESSANGKANDEKTSVERKSALRNPGKDEGGKKICKVVSFDEHTFEIQESRDNDGDVEELFKRIQAQRDILGEILEKQEAKKEVAINENGVNRRRRGSTSPSSPTRLPPFDTLTKKTADKPQKQTVRESGNDKSNSEMLNGTEKGALWTDNENTKMRRHSKTHLMEELPADADVRPAQIEPSRAASVRQSVLDDSAMPKMVAKLSEGSTDSNFEKSDHQPIKDSTGEDVSGEEKTMTPRNQKESFVGQVYSERVHEPDQTLNVRKSIRPSLSRDSSSWKDGSVDDESKAAASANVNRSYDAVIDSSADLQINLNEMDEPSENERSENETGATTISRGRLSQNDTERASRRTSTDKPSEIKNDVRFDSKADNVLHEDDKENDDNIAKRAVSDNGRQQHSHRQDESRNRASGQRSSVDKSDTGKTLPSSTIKASESNSTLPRSTIDDDVSNWSPANTRRGDEPDGNEGEILCAKENTSALKTRNEKKEVQVDIPAVNTDLIPVPMNIENKVSKEIFETANASFASHSTNVTRSGSTSPKNAAREVEENLDDKFDKSNIKVSFVGSEEKIRAQKTDIENAIATRRSGELLACTDDSNSTRESVERLRLDESQRKLPRSSTLNSSIVKSVSDSPLDDENENCTNKWNSVMADLKSEYKREFPRILSGMDQDIDTYESLSASFAIRGNGVPRPSVQWYKDGEEILESKHFVMSEDGDEYKLEILDLKACDSGTYTAKLTNRVGETSKEAKLLISNVENLRGPKLKEPLKKETVVRKQRAILEGTFVADPIPEAIWTFDGNDVNAEFTVDIKELDLGLKECTYRMAIPSSELSDTGTYKLKVKNKFGTAESSAWLTIVMKPEIEVFRDLVVPPTMPCTFEVTVMSFPEADVSWYINDEKITPTTKHRYSSEKIDQHRTMHRLSVEDCGIMDEGEYKIVAANNVGESNAMATLKLYTEKPSFLKLLEDRTVQDFDLLQMKIRVNGLPTPKVTWYRNGEPIISDSHLQVETSKEGQLSTMLTIEHFTKDDVATYKLKAENMVGEAETSAKLTLAQIEPSFAESLKRITEVSVGEPLEISTKVIGSPIPSVQWYKNGEEIKADDERVKTSVSPAGMLKLNIERVDTTDCGAYKAVAVNDLGKSIANTAVVVNQSPTKPIFVKRLEDLVVIEGHPIKLEVQIDGFPQPTVKWLKDGHPLHACPQMDFICAPNNTYGLTIEKAALQDFGQYSVVISNKCGEESNSNFVLVTPANKAPVFQMQLQPAKVVEGYPAKLEVKIEGFPLPELTWYFNGSPLEINNVDVKLATTPEGNHCLLIEKVSPANVGEYEVIAKNDSGQDSSKARLTVASRLNFDAEQEKPVFLHGLRDVTVDESGQLYLQASFRGNPIPDVLWFKDGGQLLPNERIHFTCDGYKVGVEIRDVNMADMGFYSCALRNILGEDSSAAHVAVRKLYQSPIFTQRFRHIQQLPNHDAKFHCRVTGVPFPNVMWHRNGLFISNSDKYQIKRDGDICGLTVFNVGHADEATYSCIASNRDGTATCEAQLQVVDKIDTSPKQETPQFMKKIGDCEIYPGMTAKFTACASGYPEPEYEWFCDGIRLHPSNRIEMEKDGSGLVRLKINNANPDIDTGRIRLRAFNPYGEVFCEANIIFDKGLETKYKRPLGELYKDYDKFRATGAPLPLADKPIICRMTDRHLTLSWKPSIPIGPREPVTYLVEMEEQPNGKWFTARAGIRSCVCDIHNLKPFVDYKFRVRVENNYGISDPSPFAITYREKLEPDPPKLRTYLLPNEHFHPDTAHYFPKNFDIERPPHDNYAQAPRFLRQEYDTQYGVKGHNVNLFWFVYGYPKPKISYYFNEELVEMSGRYDCSYTRNGQATLFINKMLDRDMGVYEAVAVNEHGTARQRVQLKIAEYPEFLKRPEETFVPLRKSCKLEARIIGVPYPEIKWYKDWQPLAPSSRIQIDKVEPDLCILRIGDIINKDEGLYSISARNIAGSISTSVYVHVEESQNDTIVGGKRGHVLTRNKKMDDVYDLGDELGRGTQGIIFHAVERNTGKNFAAKIMHGTGDLRKWMTNELDIMNQLNHRNIIRPYDSLSTSNTFTIIEELASGGPLLDVLTRKTYVAEYEISQYIQQLLQALDHMHEFNIAHLGLTPGDLLISHPGSDHLKLTDFGLSRRINSRKLEPLFFGMPEFVAPEVVNGEGVGLSADMWSVGVIAHLLLTGTSLFKGKDDMDTLNRIKENRFTVSTDISEDARDFIVKLLMINPNNRMDVRSALNHTWIRMGTKIRTPLNDQPINTENLRNYNNLFKDWYSNSSCRTWFRRRPLDSVYEHPSRMVYPPGHAFSPAPSPEPYTHDENNKEHKSWKDRIPSRQPLDIDMGMVKSESHYQYGPDTYLLQLRDVDFPVRLREYMKVAKIKNSEGMDWQAPVIRERRRFMDVMDEEIDDERKSKINEHGLADVYTMRRLKQEVGIRPSAHVEAEAILGARVDGLPPFFREKPQTLAIEIEKPAELVCYAVGSPKPLVQWFKNDLVIADSQRVKVIEDNDGRSILRFSPAIEYDLGIYRVVARNKFGQTTARTRMVVASEPSPPEPPEIIDASDTEVLLKWKQPKDDGNSAILCYGLQYQENDDDNWKMISQNIDHEAWLAHDLKPGTDYLFRLLAMNKIGWSIPSFPSQAVKTKLPGAEKIIVPHVLRNMQLVCEKGKEIIGDDARTMPDYTLEYQCLQWEEQPPEDKYRYISEIARGRFSVIVKAINSENGTLVAAKLMETNSSSEAESEVNREFDIFRTMRHERIVQLIEAFKLQFASVTIFIMEKLQGADVLTYLTNRHMYNEQIVTTIITQVLDGLQYIHWRGYCHLNLQPDNIVMASARHLQIKLIDFSCAQRVNKLGTVVQNKGDIEFTAPELLCEEPAYSYSDIWSVGVLTYILLSGISPFKGCTELETRQNITFVRYRFEHLYKNLSQEALRFIMFLFKRTPSKRPSAEDCHEHRWLLPTEYMIKKREKTIFESCKLKSFADEYHKKREAVATKSKEILSVLGGRIARSNSIIEELEISNVPF